MEQTLLHNQVGSRYLFKSELQIHFVHFDLCLFTYLFILFQLFTRTCYLSHLYILFVEVNLRPSFNDNFQNINENKHMSVNTYVALLLH